MAPIRFEAWSHPEDPGGFRRVAADLPVRWANINDPAGIVGTGTVHVPAAHPDTAALLSVDPGDPESAQAAYLSVWRDGADLPDFEWMAEESSTPIGDGDEVATITGRCVRGALSGAVVYPDPLTGGDWIWGGRDIIPKELVDVGQVVRIAIANATGGTFTISDGTNTTAALDYAATAALVESRIETDLGYANVLVTGANGGPYRIEYVDPSGAVAPLTVNTASLTGTDVTATVTIERTGETVPSGWTISQRIDTGSTLEFGTHASGSPSVVTSPIDAAEGATWSYRFNGLNQFAGVQTVVSVTPGSLWQFRTRLFTTGGSDLWRVVIRPNVEEPPIAWSTPFGGFTLTPSTWTTVEIPDIVIPEGVFEVVVRIAYVGTGNPAPMYINVQTGTLMEEGRVRTTAGGILTALMDAAHDRGALTWISVEFDATDDAGADPWDTPEISFRADIGEDYAEHVAFDLQLMGYEWDVRRLAAPSGGFTHGLHLYNPGGRGAGTEAGGVTYGVNVGPGGLIQRRIPARTHLLVEDDNGERVEVTDTGLSTLPRSEGFMRAEFATNLDAATQAGAAQLEDDRANLVGAQVRVTDWPWALGDIGATVPFALSAVDRHPRRLSTFTATYDAAGDVWDHEVTASRVFAATETGQQSAMWEAIRRLYAEFARRRRPRPPQPTMRGGKGGGMPTVVVAASNASAISKSKADFVCELEDATDEILAALAVIGSQGGRVVLTEGYFALRRGEIILPGFRVLEGVGWGPTQIGPASGGASSGPLIQLGVSSFSTHTALRHVQFYQSLTDETTTVQVVGPLATVEHVSFYSGNGNDLLITGNWATVRSVYSNAGQLKATNCNFLTIDGHTSEQAGDQPEGNIIYLDGVNDAVVSNVVTQSGGSWVAGSAMIRLNNCDRVIISGLNIGSNGAQYTVHMSGGCVECSVVGSRLSGSSGGNGAVLITGSSRCGVSDSQLEGISSVVGVSIVDSSDCWLIDCLLTRAGGGTNNNDAIGVTGTSDRTRIVGNRIMGNVTGSNVWRYAVAVGASATGTLIVGNDARAATGTGLVDDAGTGTELDWPSGADGANWA